MGESPTPESAGCPDAIAARMRQRVGMRSNSTKPEAPARRRILIVDNHSLVRRGLTALIDNEADLTVCAAVASPQAGLEAIASSRPDLVVTDLALDDGDGLALVREIRAGHEGLPILVLTMHDAPVHARCAFRAGALGYVSKSELGETLLVAIRCVLGGEKFVSPQLRESLDLE
jgi:DNA-binding NarL/FixJ family response regulator